MTLSRQILIDSREKQPYPLKGRVVKLNTGDYTLEGLEGVLSVDRKASVSELAANIVDPRFGRELDRLMLIKHSYILCEFSYADILNYPVGSEIPRRRHRFIKVRGPFITAAIAKITADGVNVILAGSREGAQKFLAALLKRIDKIYEGNGN